MKLGAYTAVLHDKPLPEALRILREMGLESAEINSGGFLPARFVRVQPDEPDAVPPGGRYAAATLLEASGRSELSMTRGGR